MPCINTGVFLPGCNPTHTNPTQPIDFGPLVALSIQWTGLTLGPVGLGVFVPGASGIYAGISPFGFGYSNSFGDYDVIVIGWGNNSTMGYNGAISLRTTGNWEALPEPGTKLVFATGLGLMALLRWRRSRLRPILARDHA
jgi:hypothetical protein